MSAPLDVTARNIALDALLGDGAAAGMPSSFDLALFDGDPRTGGAELTSDGGYARVTGIANDSTNFPDAVDGQKTCSNQTFPTATDAWSDTAVWFAFFAAGIGWFHGPLGDEISVDVFGTVVKIQPAMYWDAES